MGTISCFVVGATTLVFSKHRLLDSPLIVLVMLGILLGFWLVWIGVCVVVAAVTARRRDNFDPYYVFQTSLIQAFFVGILFAVIYALWAFVVRPLFFA